MSKRKPLEVVRVVRDRAVAAAARTLTEAERAAEAARLAATNARSHEEETRTRARAQVEAEQQIATSPRDLAQLAAFQVGTGLAIERVAEQTRAAAERAKDAEAVEIRSREGLVEARVALDVVEKHQETAAKRADRERDARVDEVAEDAHAARFGKRT